MKKDFSNAALLLKNEKIGARVGAVDCTVHKQLAEKFEINGFPTLKYFEKGKVLYEYDGKRTAEAMVNFIKEKRKIRNKKIEL